MARTFRAPPQYVQTLQTGAQGSLNPEQSYQQAVTDKYNADYGALLREARQTNQGTGAYNPREAATYAAAEQARYQGGQAVAPQALGQIAYDQAQRQNLQQVGAQRGSGGQAQGLRAAMMGTTQGAGQQAQAGMAAQQEQVAQRQGILQQRLATEAQQMQASRDWQSEKDRFAKEKEENDADTQGGIFRMASAAFSDERAKTKAKKVRAPGLVIMIGGK